MSLWAYQTTSKRPIGSTLFTLAYGMEVTIPTEIGMSTAKIVMQNQRDDDEEFIKQLDWAYEMRGDITIWMASYYQRAIIQYNKMAQPRFFRPISLVLRRIFKNTIEIGVESYKLIGKGHML